MSYGSDFIRLLARLARDGVLPRPASRIVELGSQMLNAGTDASAPADLIETYRGSVGDIDVPRYANEMWRAAGLDYFSLDITGAPDSRVFDLNFASVPDADRASADIVTNLGTTEHLMNQFNAFKVVHDLLRVGGVAVHYVPFAGMLNHCFFTYHPKFFYSMIVNNRYRLRHVEYGRPGLHASLGEGNTVFEGDTLRADERIPGAKSWADIRMFSGMIMLVVERRHLDDFVPPVDFAGGYFGETTGFDLAALVGRDPPHSAWADAYRRKVTPSQQSS